MIVHVGQHKTGTTSLQNFLFDNRETLLEHQILYPKTGTHKKQHSLFPGVYLAHHGYLPADRPVKIEELIKDLENEMEAEGCNKCILSSEVFSELMSINKVHLNTIMESLASLNYSLRIILTCRDNDQQALSAIKGMMRESLPHRHCKILSDTYQALLNTKRSFESGKKDWKLNFKNVTTIDYDDAAKTGMTEHYLDVIFELIGAPDGLAKEVLKNKNQKKVNFDVLQAYHYIIAMKVSDLSEEKAYINIWNLRQWLDRNMSSAEERLLCENINDKTIIDFINFRQRNSKNNIANITDAEILFSEKTAEALSILTKIASQYSQVISNE